MIVKHLLVHFGWRSRDHDALELAAEMAHARHCALTVVGVVGGLARLCADPGLRSLVADPSDSHPASPLELMDAHLCAAILRLSEDVPITRIIRGGRAVPVLLAEADRACCDVLMVSGRRLAARLRAATDIPVICSAADGVRPTARSSGWTAPPERWP